MKDRSVSAPTYEELAALVVALQTRIAEQDARIAELERQLAASSRNSSKPPSTDGLGKPAPKSLRGRSGRKPGGQPGREGRTLRQGAVPDEGGVHEPGACAGCGVAVVGDEGPAGGVRRQGRAAAPEGGVVRGRGACAGGGFGWVGDERRAGVSGRRVFDTPQTPVGVVEPRLVSRRCVCGVLTCAAGPAGVSAPV